jgi:hypothetical protein
MIHYPIAISHLAAPGLIPLTTISLFSTLTLILTLTRFRFGLAHSLDLMHFDIVLVSLSFIATQFDFGCYGATRRVAYSPPSYCTFLVSLISPQGHASRFIYLIFPLLSRSRRLSLGLEED